MAPTPGPVEHFVYNAVGHTVALTDEAGAVTQASLYEAFGQTVAQAGGSGNNRLANTKERDASLGLDNHGFRYYDPASGRYISRDPIGYGDGMNVYASVHNNPINGVDPVGLYEWRAFFSGAWQGTKDAGRALAGVPRGLKDTITNVGVTIMCHGGNAVGLVSDDDAMRDSPLVHYWAGHINNNTYPVAHEVKEVGVGLYEGDPEAYRTVGVQALTAAAAIKVVPVRTGAGGAPGEVIEVPRIGTSVRPANPGVAGRAALGEIEAQLDAAYAAGKRALQEKASAPKAPPTPPEGSSFPGTKMTRIDDLAPPPGRPIAEPSKLSRMGPFDWAKYQPISVTVKRGIKYLQDGPTRVQKAREAGIQELPAKVTELKE